MKILIAPQVFGFEVKVDDETSRNTTTESKL